MRDDGFFHAPSKKTTLCLELTDPRVDLVSQKLVISVDCEIGGRSPSHVADTAIPAYAPAPYIQTGCQLLSAVASLGSRNRRVRSP
jgi:hypothetical protein